MTDDTDHPDLEAAIQQLIHLGEKDPLTIARKLKKRFGEKWLLGELLARDEEILAEIARHRLGSRRRGAQLATVVRSTKAQSELLLSPVWIPVTKEGEGGWKSLGDVTASDLRELAIYHARLSAAADRMSQWCIECAKLMEQHNAQRLSDVRADLPVLADLPDRAELERGVA
jgi:hypothetical protein